MNEESKVLNEEMKELPVTEEQAPVAMLDTFKQGSLDFFSTKQLKNEGDKKIVYNALTTNGQVISDHVGDKIRIVDVVAYPVKFVDENSGDLIEALRVALIDDKGISWTATSAGIANSVQKLMSIYGAPTYNPPVEVQIKQIKSRNSENKTNVLVVV